MEWNNGRITKPPEVLLEFHKRKLGKAATDKSVAYHTDRVDYLSGLVEPVRIDGFSPLGRRVLNEVRQGQGNGA